MVLVLVMSASLVCAADGGARTHEYDLFGAFQILGDDRDTLGNGASAVRQDDTIAGGIGVGWFINEHLNLNTDVMFGIVDLIGSTRTVKADFGVWNVNLDWYPWKSAITPVFTGGVGLLSYRTELAPVTQNEFNDEDFSYNLGAGMRWDINELWFAKAVYRVIWAKWDGADDNVTLESISLMLGLKCK
jgi:opacity protein-like surface antigen